MPNSISRSEQLDRSRRLSTRMMGGMGVNSSRSVLGHSSAVWPVQQSRDFAAERFFTFGEFCCSTCGEYREPWEECQNFICASNSELVRMYRDIEESHAVDALSGTLGTVDVDNRTMLVRDELGTVRAAFGDAQSIRGASADIVGADELLASYETPTPFEISDVGMSVTHNDSLLELDEILRTVRNTNQQFTAWTRYVASTGGGVTWSNSTH